MVAMTTNLDILHTSILRLSSRRSRFVSCILDSSICIYDWSKRTGWLNKTLKHEPLPEPRSQQIAQWIILPRNDTESLTESVNHRISKSLSELVNHGISELLRYSQSLNKSRSGSVNDNKILLMTVSLNDQVTQTYWIVFTPIRHPSTSHPSSPSCPSIQSPTDLPLYPSINPFTHTHPYIKKPSIHPPKVLTQRAIAVRALCNRGIVFDFSYFIFGVVAEIRCLVHALKPQVKRCSRNQGPYDNNVQQRYINTRLV